MLIYRCNVGQTLIDETSDWLYMEPQVEESYPDFEVEPEEVADTWSGARWDYYSNKPEPSYYS